MTLDDEIGVAVGVMGMSYETFVSLTPYQFQRANQLYIEKIQKEREQADLTAWQVARWQVWRTLCPPDLKKISVMDLIELPGDEKYRASSSSATGKNEKRFEDLAKLWKE